MKRILFIILTFTLSIYAQSIQFNTPRFLYRTNDSTAKFTDNFTNLRLGNGQFRWFNSQLQFSNDLTNWYAIPQSLPTGGGWTLGLNKIYQTTSGTPIHIRTNAGDTTGTALVNIYGNLSIVPSSSTSSVLTTRSLQSTAPLGSELVTNGTFDSDAGWTWGAGWIYDDTNKEADHTTGETDPLRQSVNVTNGTTYQISFQIKNRTTGSITIDINGVFVVNFGPENNFSSNSTFNRTFTANTTGSVLLSITPTSDFDGSIDNVSIKAITGVSQPNLSLIDDVNNIFAELRGNRSLSNIALGIDALRRNTTGYSNSAIGGGALYSNTTGHSNSAIGVSALYSNTTGYFNSAIGGGALYSNTTGHSNSAIGVSALYSNTTGHFNSAIGINALYSNTTGHNNSALGRGALYSNTTGYNNSVVGAIAGGSLTIGSDNVFVGYYSGFSGLQKVDAQNSIAIGANTYTTSNNQVVIGSGTTTHGLGKIPALTSNGLDINGTTIRLQFRTITSPTATGNVGEMCYDANYIYICVATNTWKRIPIPSSW